MAKKKSRTKQEETEIGAWLKEAPPAVGQLLSEVSDGQMTGAKVGAVVAAGVFTPSIGGLLGVLGALAGAGFTMEALGKKAAGGEAEPIGVEDRPIETSEEIAKAEDEPRSNSDGRRIGAWCIKTLRIEEFERPEESQSSSEKVRWNDKEPENRTWSIRWSWNDKDKPTNTVASPVTVGDLGIGNHTIELGWTAKEGKVRLLEGHRWTIYEWDQQPIPKEFTHGSVEVFDTSGQLLAQRKFSREEVEDLTFQNATIEREAEGKRREIAAWLAEVPSGEIQSEEQKKAVHLWLEKGKRQAKEFKTEADMVWLQEKIAPDNRDSLKALLLEAGVDGVAHTSVYGATNVALVALFPEEYSVSKHRERETAGPSEGRYRRLATSKKPATTETYQHYKTPPVPNPLVEAFEKEVAKRLAAGELPLDYKKRREAVGELKNAGRTAIAAAMQDAFNAEAKRRAKEESDDYEGKKEVAKWINEELRHLDLAILDKDSQKPAIIGVGPGRQRRGEYRIQVDGGEGKRPRVTKTSAALPEFTLIPVPFGLSRVEHQRQR